MIQQGAGTLGSQKAQPSTGHADPAVGSGDCQNLPVRGDGKIHGAPVAWGDLHLTGQA